jgi:hypothetical protein
VAWQRYSCRPETVHNPTVAAEWRYSQVVVGKALI